MTTASGPEMYSDWNRRPSSPATNNDLHRQIMELPCKPPANLKISANYALGHQDARHAAANLALRSSPAPVNTQGLREALERIVNIPNAIDGGDWDEIDEAREIASRALAQAEQEQPAPGLSLSDAAEALQNLAGGKAVGIWQKLAIPAQPGTSTVKINSPRTLVMAYADNGTSTPVTAGGESIESVLGQMADQLSKQQQ